MFSHGHSAIWWLFEFCVQIEIIGKNGAETQKYNNSILFCCYIKLEIAFEMSLKNVYCEFEDITEMHCFTSISISLGKNFLIFNELNECFCLGFCQFST